MLILSLSLFLFWDHFLDRKDQKDKKTIQFDDEVKLVLKRSDNFLIQVSLTTSRHAKSAHK